MFANYYEDSEYSHYFTNGVRAVRNKLSLYDLDYGSIYDQYTKGNKLGMGYHKIHYIQLYYLYLRTKDDYFRKISKKWYELQQQSDYTIKINNDKKEKTKLNDGIYWYQSWSETTPTEIAAIFDKKYDIKAINFFSVTEIDNFDLLEIQVETNQSDFKILEPNSYEIKQKGYNDSKGKETFVYVVYLQEPINTQKIKLVFKGQNSKLELREIGFHKEMKDQYTKEMEKFKHMEEISKNRRKLLD